jgi:anti-sigma B factor antagonist
MNLRAELLPGEDVPVVAVYGELDIEGAPELRMALVEAIDAHPGQRVVVDLEGVDFIDSAGLGVLLGGLERARGAGGDLTLVATGQGVIKVLELTGLTRVFEIHPSRHREA